MLIFMLTMETQLVLQCEENLNVKCFQTFTHGKAVGYKGHLVCIEILKAKAAIMFDRFCRNKAQQEVESQRKNATMKVYFTVYYCLLFYS